MIRNGMLRRLDKVKSQLGPVVSVLFYIVPWVYIFLQIGRSWKVMQQQDNYMFEAYGRKALDSFEPNSIVLVNGDLNNNAIKYVHQCHSHRLDVQVLSLQLVTWEWFVPVQAKNYNITFPGNRYHPRMKGGFSIKQFLDANYKKRKIYLCGPWKDGDNSYEADYQTVPFGVCDLVIKKKEFTKFSMALHIPKMLESLPVEEIAPSFDRVKFGEETWERVMANDIWNRWMHYASLIAYHSMTDRSEKKHEFLLTGLAVKCYDGLLQLHVNPKRRVVFAAVPLTEYRSAGVIYGRYSEMLKAKGDTDLSKYNSMKMYLAWKLYLFLVTISLFSVLLKMRRKKIRKKWTNCWYL